MCAYAKKNVYSFIMEKFIVKNCMCNAYIKKKHKPHAQEARLALLMGSAVDPQ